MRIFTSLFILFLSTALYSCKKATLFKQMPSSQTGITFNNKIIENDSINPLDMINIYNGGGVGIGDFNGDGLPDIYFTGNAVSNKLYLNRGGFKFEDITPQAGVGGKGGWGRGVAVVDINNDGRPDIYVCNTLLNDPAKRTNLLYINTGNAANGVPRFKEQAKDYGLDANCHSTMASFFDYDNDGDLDMYLTVNESLQDDNQSIFKPTVTDGSHPSTGRLYRNDYNAGLGHGMFTNVSKQAGITIMGYGHGTTIVDINRDGWKDIYVTNDFLSSNILYINNHDGTFTDKSQQYFKHTSASGMGQDVVDINNDGLADVFELDMNPEDNYRKKMFMSPNSYQMYQNFDYYHYQYQYPRNTLQVNEGPRVGQNDSIGDPAFGEMAFLSGIAQTDWSWCPIITDFDNDGYRDIVITNGYPRDVTDHDFLAFRNNAVAVASKQQVLTQIPVVQIPNYAYHNKGNLRFDDVSKDWGLTVSTFSNGGVYADLDNDGDLDMVINNINSEAMVYKNTSRENEGNRNHYLQIAFEGNKDNKEGLGAWADIYYNHGQHQVYEHNPFRGYLSTMQNIAHFGLGKISKVDSVVIKWPGGMQQTLTQVKADTLLKVNYANARKPYSFNRPAINTQSLFTEVTRARGINYKHQDDDFIDFNIQKLLPHKLSEYAPALSAGDVDGNGYDDMVIGGTSKYPAQVLLQQANGKFIQKALAAPLAGKATVKDEGTLLFDADGDGDLDLYVASGGYENEPNSPAYQDRLYINDGKGNYTLAANALPQNYTSKLCVRGVDYDKDGDVDLFVSGRVSPWNYPKPVSSCILRNDSRSGQVKFTDVTASVAPALHNAGLVCDALFTDFDNDGWPDLIMAGEWMPVKFLKNNKGAFKDVTASSGMSNELGWWNTIAAGDFDHDGDIDYLAGNTGLNTFYKASDKYPMFITAKDYDQNGSYDAFPSLYLKDQEGKLKEFPAQTRDDVVKQMISMRIKFQNYKSFATATMDEMITPDMRKGEQRLKVNNLQTCYLQNDGKGKFTCKALPIEAQASVWCGITVDDFDGDGNLDVIVNGNDYGTEVTTGRYDALNGLYLKGNGKGGFQPLSILKSGIYIQGNGKALVKLRGANNNYMIAATQNRDVMKLYQLKRKAKLYNLLPNDAFADIKYKNGARQKQEFYQGASFLSQSARFIKLDEHMATVTVTNNKGESRSLKLD